MDKKAYFEDFFRAEYPRVIDSVRFITGDSESAADFAQDAFLRLLRHWGRISKYEDPSAWVRRVAINQAISSLRRRRVAERFLPMLTPADVQYESTTNELLGALAQLSPHQRAAIVLFYYEDRPTAEIARILGCSAATAKVHLHKARKRLGSILSKEMTDVG